MGPGLRRRDSRRPSRGRGGVDRRARRSWRDSRRPRRMRQIPVLPFARSEDERVVAGVCSGIAAALGVDARLVRLVFALLALAGGTGILLYLALWLWTSGRRPLLLVLVPWVWQVAHERAERIRIAERAEMAARIHDSVLQTLALVQRHATDAQRVTTLARYQERELRRWLYGRGFGRATTLGDALAEAVADVEDAHGVRIELASAGDTALDEPLSQLVLAAREALTNAAKHSEADEIAVYADVGSDAVSVFVRDRGVGFTRSDVDTDRRGLTESIEARLARAGGSATVTSSPGEGTEVELTLPRQES